MEADIVKMEEDDDTILIIVGDEGLKIKEEIVTEADSDLVTPDTLEDDTLIIKEEILDVTFEYSNDSECNEELMPMNKVEAVNEDYWSLSKDLESNDSECNEELMSMSKVEALNEDYLSSSKDSESNYSECNEELMPMNKVEALNENYLSSSKDSESNDSECNEELMPMNKVEATNEDYLSLNQDSESNDSEYNEELMPMNKVEAVNEDYVSLCKDSEEKAKKELMPMNKVEALNEDYVSLSKDWVERAKKKDVRASGEKMSLVKELKQKYPELAEAENKNMLISALLEIMRSVKPPPLPQDYYVMNDIMFECVICSGLTETIPAAGRHYLEKHGPRYLYCYACGINYRSRTSLYVHEKRCSARDQDILLRARAVWLGNKGKTRPYLGLAKSFPKSTPSVKTGKPNPFACPQCPAVFSGKEGLRAHTHLHLGLRPFQCHQCVSAYTSRGGLSRHVKRKHGNDKFVCDHCDRVFKLKDGLVTHMDTHLPRDRRKFECVDCGRRFGQKHTMQLHAERKHLGVPPQWACQLCPQRFRRTNLLKVHMKKAHGVVLMTQHMFYKALPTMTDAQVKSAIAYKVL